MSGWQRVASIVAVFLLIGSACWSATPQLDEIDALVKQLRERNEAGQLADATALVERLVGAVERRFGRKSERYADALSILSLHYLRSGRQSEAEEKCRAALLIRQEIRGPDHIDIAVNLSLLADIQSAQKNHSAAEQSLRTAIAMRKRLGMPDARMAAELRMLGLLLAEQARHSEAIQLFGEAIEITRAIFGSEHIKVAELVIDLVRSRKDEDARPMLDQAKQAIALSIGKESRLYADALALQGEIAASRRAWEEAENLTKEAHALLSKILGPEAQETVMALAALGNMIAMQGRYEEAHPLQLRALEIRERTLGPDHYDTAESLLNVAGSFANQGRVDLAIEYQRRSIPGLIRNWGESHPNVAFAYEKLGSFYSQAGEHEQAAEALLKAMRIYEMRRETDTLGFARHLEASASFYLNQKRPAAARQVAERALAIKQRYLPLGHAELAFTYRLIMLAAGRMGDLEAVLENFTLATNERTDPASGRELRPPETSIEHLAGLAAISARLMAERKPSADDRLREQAFVADQYTDQSSSGSALLLMGARQASEDPKLGKVARERQDLAARWAALDQRLITALSAPANERRESSVAILRHEIDEIDKKLIAVDETLTNDFPAYYSLTRPRPLSVAEVQGLLGGDEVLVKIDHASGLVWAIGTDKAEWGRLLSASPADLLAKVQAIRCGLDRVAWDGEGGPRCTELLKLREMPGDADPLPFDIGGAHELYQALFGPVRNLIKGKRLLIVPSGPLMQLPFQALVSEKPDLSLTGTDAFRLAAWLSKSHAITILPAVSSLRAVRQQARTSRASQPFIGFGNPLLDGPDARYEPRAKLARERQQCPKTGSERVVGVFGKPAGVRAPTQRNHLVDVGDIRTQIPLPETADELCAVARDLGVPTGDIRLGARSTERDIKMLSESGGLAAYRIIHFATHGAVAGELKPGAEPGLILTPPNTSTAEDDGYLSASEIAALKLDADWVILSACNTGAGGAYGAEALSGLARAFFYAGARALLVSHWAVYSDSTVKLITKALRIMATDKTVGRSEALRQSMLALIEKGEPHEAHPMYWAPFVVVGEGSAQPTPQTTSSVIRYPEPHRSGISISKRPAPSKKTVAPDWATEVLRP